MIEENDLPVAAEFEAWIRRPLPLSTGMTAQLFGENGPAADAVMALGKTALLDALVDVTLFGEEGELGGFEGYIRRPKPTTSGMVALFFGENGDAADMISALGLSKFLDRKVHVRVRLVQNPDGAAPKKEKGPFSKQSAALWKSAFFRNRLVWEAVGTDADFLAWCRRQKCCVNVEKYGKHEGDIVPMHVRRVANGAGTATKPEYSAIPGCNRHHQMQHGINGGESAVGGKEFYDQQRIKHLQRWAWESLVAEKGYSSMTFVDPRVVFEWAREHQLEKYLPLEYCLPEFVRAGN